MRGSAIYIGIRIFDETHCREYCVGIYYKTIVKNRGRSLQEIIAEERYGRKHF